MTEEYARTIYGYAYIYLAVVAFILLLKSCL